MGRTPLRTDVDDMDREIRRQNVICSGKFLKALRQHHGVMAEPEPESPPLPEPPQSWRSMWFHDLIFANPKPSDRVIKIGEIQRAVAQEYGVPVFEMLSARRTLNIIGPRQVGYYLSKKLTSRSLPEIGRRFGGRDHTSILSGIRKIERLLLTDHALAARIEKIRMAIA